MRRLALVLLVLASCKRSKEDTCDQLAKMGTAFANELGKRVGGDDELGESGEIKSKMAELKAECMAWPDEVFECMRDNDETSAKCVEAMQHVTGRVATDVLKAPAGPAVVATATIGETTWDGLPLTLRDDGSVIAAVEDSIVSYAATGKSNWRTLMKHDRWMLVEGDLVLTGDREKHAIVALDADTGEVKWQVGVPQGDDEYSSVSTEGGVRIGAMAYVALDSGSVVRLDPAACAKKNNKGCLDVAFTLADEELDNPRMFALGNDLVIAESTAIRRISTSGEILGHIHVRDDLGGAMPAGDQRVAAIIDDELVMIDFAKCGASPAALRRKQGRMYLRGEGECENCTAPPLDGCLSRSPLDDLDSIAPTVLADGSLVASNFDGPLLATSAGAKKWASEVDSVGPLRESGSTVVFLSRDDEEKPVRVAALDVATGKAKWSTPIAGWKSKDLMSSSDVTVETNGSWIVVGLKGRLAWLKTP